MTDWEKLKVAELKEELKSRGIPLTGLKLKQQFIDKLNELDGEIDREITDTERDAVKSSSADEDSRNVADEHNDEAVQPTTVATEDAGEGRRPDSYEEAPAEVEPSNSAPANDDAPPQNETNTYDRVTKVTSTTPSDEITGAERVARLPDHLPAALKKEESHAKDGSTPPPVEAESEAEEKTLQKDDPFIVQQASEASEQDEPETTFKASSLDKDLEMQDIQPLNENTSIQSPTDPTASTRVPTPEILEDRRKRKRRSVSPAPDRGISTHKRVRTDSKSPLSTATELDALRRVQESTDAAQANRDSTFYRESTQTGHFGSKINSDPDTDDEQIEDSDRKQGVSSSDRAETDDTPSQSSHSPGRDVAPSIHPATCSLYIRNFKRPLHIPTLRSHISSLAKSSDQDPLKLFYLDSVRTHAFVSFSSISAASRVRTAMHETRFPDEPMRDLLWIDFIPDERVQNWIDTETGGAGGGLGGGRGSSKKYEVVYNEDSDGVSAALQEVSSTITSSQHPIVQQSRSNRMVPQDPTASGALASNMQPTSAPFVPRATPSSRTQGSQPPAKSSDAGKGFRALDELFSSTIAKPKLYYKLPSQTVVDDRLDLIRDLRVNHDQMGQSGDEGMKRFSFEKDDRTSREAWVDKGPEFGFGRRGQERLVGHGAGYGGSRGRGGFRGGRRGGDSWRSR